MQYRRFGKTEIQMPVITCGGMRYQQTWQEAKPDPLDENGQANLAATVRRAFDLGIHHIETARGYGSSEYQLGLVLPELPRDRLIVQTKLGPKDSEAEFMEQFEISFNNLQLQYIDLVAIHGINNNEILEKTLKGGNLRALRRLQDQGIIRHIGFSTHGPTETLLNAIATDEFSYINLHWYYFDQLNRPAVELAHAKDMGVFIISPCDKGGKLYSPPDRLVELCKPLTPMGFNDLFCLSLPYVHTLSIGAKSPSDFDAHVDAIKYLDSAEETIAPILHRLADAGRCILGDDWMSGWATGLPAPEETPGTIPLYHVLRLYTMLKAYDMLEYGKMRYNLLGNGGHWFAGQKVDPALRSAIATTLKDHPLRHRLVDAIMETHALLNEEDKKRLSEESD